jgi:hypothetical protein
MWGDGGCEGYPTYMGKKIVAALLPVECSIILLLLARLVRIFALKHLKISLFRYVKRIFGAMKARQAETRSGIFTSVDVTIFFCIPLFTWK